MQNKEADDIDRKQLPIMQNKEADDISTYSLVEVYNSSLKSLLDRHAPLQNKQLLLDKDLFARQMNYVLLSARKDS